MAEVSKMGRYRRGEMLRCMDGRANPRMDRKVIGVVILGVLQWSPQPQQLDVWRSAVLVVVVIVVVVVVYLSCSCSSSSSCSCCCCCSRRRSSVV